MKTQPFSDALLDAVREKNSHVVVGLDPRPELLPDHLQCRMRGAGHTAEAVAEAFVEFNTDVIGAVADLAVAVKCQIAFYECLGLAGLDAYRRTIRCARDHGLLVIGDVKRNDIGSTAEAYARAHLPGCGAEEPPGASSDFHVDALTVNPFFGIDGIRPFLDRAVGSGCGIFVLLRTSNPSSGQMQELDCDGRPVYEHLADLIHGWGAGSVGSHGYSAVGAVVGATFPRQLSELRSMMPHTPFLIPGFGAQGGSARDVAGGFDRDGRGAVVSASRSLTYAFRTGSCAGRCGEVYTDAVRTATDDMRRALLDAIAP